MKKNVLIIGLLCIIAIFVIQKSCIVSNNNSSHDDIEKNIVVLSKAEQFSGRISYNKRHSAGKDVVPQKEIAVKMALILLESFYGKEIYNEKPYRVALLDSVWVVETSLVPLADMNNPHTNSDKNIIICGGIGHVELNKHTGEIYSIYHTK